MELRSLHLTFHNFSKITYNKNIPDHPLPRSLKESQSFVATQTYLTYV